MKCGQPLRTAPGLLVAGTNAGQVVAPKAPPRRVVQPGGFFPRLIAVIIDLFILSVVLVPLYYLWLGTKTPFHLDPGATPNPLVEQLRAIGGSSLSGYTPDQLLSIIGFYIGAAILQLFYFVGTWSILGGSPGQLVMNLRVVDNTAKGIGFGRALMRYIWKAFFGWLALVSALMVAIGKDKRAIHDLLAGTYVIQFLDETVVVGDPALAPAQPAAPAPSAPSGADAGPGVSAVVAAAANAAPAATPAAPVTQPPAPVPVPAVAATVPAAAPVPTAITTAGRTAQVDGSGLDRYAAPPFASAAAATAPMAVPPPAFPQPAAAAPVAPPQPAGISPPPAAPAPLPSPFLSAPQPPPFAAAPAPAQAPPAPAPAQAPAAPAQTSPAPLAPPPDHYEPSMTLPPLPPPTRAPMAAPRSPAPPVLATSTTSETAPRRPVAEPPIEPYPLPFALPPVVHPPSSPPPAASDQRGG